MANRTIDRKKAVAARSQSARSDAKSATIDEEEQSTLKAESDELVDETEDEMADEEDFEEEDEEAAEESESEADEAEDEEEEESRALDKPKKPSEQRVAKRERHESSLAAVNPQDYAIRRSAGSRLPDNILVRFVRASYRELQMVTWPTRQETWNWSIVVVVVCLVVAAILGAADLGLSKFVEWWISLAH